MTNTKRDAQVRQVERLLPPRWIAAEGFGMTLVSGGGIPSAILVNPNWRKIPKEGTYMLNGHERKEWSGSQRSALAGQAQEIQEFLRTAGFKVSREKGPLLRVKFKP